MDIAGIGMYWYTYQIEDILSITEGLNTHKTYDIQILSFEIIVY